MKTPKLNHLAHTLMLAVLTAGPVMADDTEIFFGSGSGSSSGNPNILLVLDTSGSMQETISTTTPYAPGTSYSGNCNATYTYFRNTSSSTLPTCNSDGTVSNSSYTRERNRVLTSDFLCSPATDSGGALSTSGYYSVNAIRWNTIASSSNYGATYTDSYAWQDTLYPEPDTDGRRRTLYTYGGITCEGHNYTTLYPNAVLPTAATQWTAVNANSYWNQVTDRTEFVFYSANYLNWYHNHRVTGTQTRLQIVQSAAKSLLGSLSGVNVGLMRYDTDGNGGMVTNRIQDIASGKTAMETEIDSWFAAGNTPLSETLSEAHRYYTGSAVNYGNGSYECSVTDTGFDGCGSGNRVSSPSVGASRSAGNDTDTNYDNPIDYACQKNYIVYLTDGEPTSDDGANTYISNLSTTDASCSGSGGCLSTLTSYMNNNDMNSTIADKQTVSTYFIGFGNDVSGGAPFAYLDAAATAGGGDAYGANDLDELTSALNDIITSIKDDSSTFTAPSVAVNAFNKTQVLEDLYVSVFQPTLKTHWPGNLKKYKLREVTETDTSTTPATVTTRIAIVGQNASATISAVDDTTGFFKSDAQSYWSDEVDGRNTAKGGAAAEIPAPADRNVYTYIGTNPTVGSLPQLSDHPVEDTNTNITDTVLGIGGVDDPARTTLINWIRGQDTNDDDDDTNTTEGRNAMGDPVHAQPAVVIYGNTGSTTTAKLNDAVVYVTTNDGYLHAIDVSTGAELWSFIPQELLDEMKTIYENPTATSKHYTLDGNLRVMKYDVDGDGVVDTADKDRVFLYFSQGRGGDRYYALDVTSKNNPKFMWSLGSADLDGIVTQSWSTPALGKVKIDGATQNSQKLVLIFAGGYDPAEDTQSYNSGGNSFGNGLFMVDAVRGTVLWSKTKESTGAFSKMTHAIPSSVAVLDTNGDGWTDRMYVGDMAGQLWRFDIFNGADDSSTDPLVTGGIIASIGAKAAATPSIANNRSFYNEPDIAKFIITGTANYYAISIGSGDRSLPKSNTTTEDRFYSIRDYYLSRRTQAQYDDLTAITDDDLTQISGTSAVPIGGNGWKLPLSSSEKALAQSITVNGVVMFTTFVPNGSSSACNVSTGGGRAYSIDLKTGLKYFTDLYETFETTGLPAQISVVNDASLIRTDGTTSSSSSSSSSGAAGAAASANTCLAGVNALGSCVTTNWREKTLWQESGAY